MRNRIARDLAPLASREFQDRFIVHGTVDEYALPEELFDNAVAIVENVVSSNVLSASLSVDEIEALRQFVRLAEKLRRTIPLDDPSVSNQELIEKSEGWIALRKSAQATLAVMGVDLIAWERENL